MFCNDDGQEWPDHDCDQYRDNRINSLLDILYKEPEGSLFARHEDIELLLEHLGVDGAIEHIKDYDKEWLQMQRKKAIANVK